MALSDSEARDWLTLIRTPGAGSGAIAGLLEAHGSPAAVIAAAGAAGSGLKPAQKDWLRRPDEAQLDADCAWLQRPDHHLITLGDPRYPPLLADTRRPPVALFVVGDPDWLTTAQLAVVGSRNPTPAGAGNARAFARELAGCGLTITSGLALGVDAAAHQGALEAGGGTLAVLGTGADRVYPASHRDLAKQIAQGGALVSEFPPGTGASKENFPQRNRIISGMAHGTLVVEAAQRSGSLITARLAGEQGREVFAIPGSIHNPLARGCHRLLREGAKLVESAADILEELGPLLGSLASTTRHRSASAEADDEPAQVDAEQQALLKALGHDAATLDDLISRTGLTPEVLSSMLLILELEGRVARTPGGAFIRLMTTGA